MYKFFSTAFILFLLSPFALATSASAQDKQAYAACKERFVRIAQISIENGRANTGRSSTSTSRQAAEKAAATSPKIKAHIYNKCGSPPA